MAAVPAGSELARLAREEAAARTRTAESEYELRLRIAQLEWELGQRATALARLAAERDDAVSARDGAAAERDAAYHRLARLKARRAVRWALRLAALRPRLPRS